MGAEPKYTRCKRNGFAVARTARRREEFQQRKRRAYPPYAKEADTGRRGSYVAEMANRVRRLNRHP